MRHQRSSRSRCLSTRTTRPSSHRVRSVHRNSANHLGAPARRLSLAPSLLSFLWIGRPPLSCARCLPPRRGPTRRAPSTLDPPTAGLSTPHRRRRCCPPPRPPSARARRPPRARGNSSPYPTRLLCLALCTRPQTTGATRRPSCRPRSEAAEAAAAAAAAAAGSGRGRRTAPGWALALPAPPMALCCPRPPPPASAHHSARRIMTHRTSLRTGSRRRRWWRTPPPPVLSRSVATSPPVPFPRRRPTESLSSGRRPRSLP